MKKITTVVLLLLFFCACSEDSADYGLGEYYKELATVVSDNTLLLDNGKYLHAANLGSYSGISKGARVYLMFSYRNNDTNNQEREIEIHAVSRISLGELRDMSWLEIASIENDPVRLDGVWLGSHYLNMQFYMNFKSIAHTIDLAYDKSMIDDDGTYRLYFIHQDNNDPPGASVRITLSFDLEPELGLPQGDRPVCVVINSSNYGNKEYAFLY